MTLEKLREQLQETNKRILSLLAQRKTLAKKIQIKKEDQGMGRFDPKRELALFSSLDKDLQALSLKELALFSLMMEAHAGKGYPEWSKGEHLIDYREGELINPLLLLLFHPEKLNVDGLKEEYKFLLKLAEERQ